MRDLESLYEALSSLGLPVAFDHFEVAQELPYIVYIVTDSNDFAADNIAYFASDNVQIELYTVKKDKQRELAVEALLTSYGVYFAKSEGYLSDEQMYMVTYQVTI